LQVVQELALVMYAALDIGLKEDEERTLSPGLENLLAHMISAGKKHYPELIFQAKLSWKFGMEPVRAASISHEVVLLRILE